MNGCRLFFCLLALVTSIASRRRSDTSRKGLNEYDGYEDKTDTDTEYYVEDNRENIEALSESTTKKSNVPGDNAILNLLARGFKQLNHNFKRLIRQNRAKLNRGQSAITSPREKQILENSRLLKEQALAIQNLESQINKNVGRQIENKRTNKKIDQVKKALAQRLAPGALDKRLAEIGAVRVTSPQQLQQFGIQQFSNTDDSYPSY